MFVDIVVGYVRGCSWNVCGCSCVCNPELIINIDYYYVNN